MKIIQLGGAFHQSFFIEEIKKFGYIVYCLDNVPYNPGHFYADNSFNISTTNIKEIKKIISKDKFILSSFGSDLGERTRIILTEGDSPKLKLFTKHDSRKLLKKTFQNQNQPNIKFASLTEQKSERTLVVKPNISSGSKGVSIIAPNNELFGAIKEAQKISLDNKAVIEEYVINDGKKYYCEGLVINKEIFLVIGFSTSSKIPYLSSNGVYFSINHTPFV